MKSSLESIRRIRLTTPLVALSALFIGAGGFIHLRLWLDLYRHIPASSPGAAVVRVGFPLNVAASLACVLALILVFRRPSRLTQPVIFAALAFQVASLATLIATRVGSLFGWAEPTWTGGPEQTRAVEVAAIVALLALAWLRRREAAGDPREGRPHATGTPSAVPVPA